MRATGVSLGQLLLALDATLVRLVQAPRGLDLPVASAALIDSDDVRLGLAPSAGSADMFFLLGVSEKDALRWVEQQSVRRPPTAIFVKEPSGAVVERAVAAGTAVVAVDPRARWERLYRLVNHVFEHHGDGALHDSGTDLFGLAQSVAERTHGMVSIEDAQSHVLSYSASSDEADELRRLSILGRAGPPEHLAWIAQWGIFDALRSRPEAVRVAERPELGLRPRLAIGIFAPAVDERRAPAFVGTIWVQQGSRPLAEDAEEVLRGAAVLAARIMARLAAAPSTHAVRVQELLGLGEAHAPVEVELVARELGVAAGGRAAVIGFDGGTAGTRLADVLALSASAFRHDAQMASVGSRVYVLFPSTGKAVASWVRGTVAALRAELGLQLHAVIASPVAGLAGAAAARTDVDRVLDTAERHPGTLAAVTSLAEARTTVLLDEIVTAIAADERLIDPRVRALRADEPVLADTLGVYLDSFGDVAAAAQHLHVHPNTVRYRIRRVEQLLAASLNDSDVRLLLSLSLRATA
ncbi:MULTISPECIES: CdaR family transcriptional regulator [unclassified Mycolicibacterium]|uniref:PucR family transcriptional regulator n=1 Tax=unclassified Mycolicibacterium TaxID=2636767 RepID=UPI0012DEB0AB|nr:MULTISPECIES: helix-turn-helix domain-containing protein [unclassified Mycolicibacterium]MUL84991.1 PucR family transcriptional regulator [Mycolicibacterium sp. CBMA 329]MUL90958.1 PucR family transcriptional regulator [Mycolicibacterium sp. CBMA 331]MUL98371.1 PucR family transcriptional regulator [Mycolicibacterium sp. CBMA 334]MUM28577.1 PucR family transcriptional regulator [Mycolicibacterium sp. CBMA 295]MUM40717.1 PucR family transcriptional regulator [Mycolicibacterium sp. CBMA 247]